ncbi:hypothetical protein K0A96_01815 [Patescibacteria group bacterium]|nr:hypothetical protein [Patescibacteria group bacterium]
MERQIPNEIINDNYNPLREAYQLVHEKAPDPRLSDLELAESIIEVIDNPNWIPRNLAIECSMRIMDLRNKSDQDLDDRGRNVILDLESGRIQNIFPELSGIDQVHMDQIEFAYRKYLEEVNSD